MTQLKILNRRDFVKAAGNGAAAASLLATSAPPASPATGRRRYAIIGTGDRGSGMWGRTLLPRYSDVLELLAFAIPIPSVPLPRRSCWE